MSQLVTFDKPKKSTLITTKKYALGASSDELSISGETVFQVVVDKIFESYPWSIEPVKVEENTIKVNENLMEEDQPYSVRYNGKDYLVTRSSGTTKLYELRD